MRKIKKKVVVIFIIFLIGIIGLIILIYDPTIEKTTIELINAQRKDPSQIISANRLAMNPKGDLVAVDVAGQLHVYGLASKKLVDLNPTREGESITDIKWSPDGKLLAVAYASATVEVWQVQNWNLLQSITCPLPASEESDKEEDGTKISFTTNNSLLATTHAVVKDVRTLGKTYLWKVQSNPELKVIDINGAVEGFSPDGKLLMIFNFHSPASEKITTVSVWSIEKAQMVLSNSFNVENRRTFNIYSCREYPCKRLAISHDSKYLAFGSDEGYIYMWDIATSNLKWKVKAYGYATGNVFFNPDSTILSSLSAKVTSDLESKDNFIKLWNVNDGSLIKTLEGPEVFPTDMAFLPDSKAIVTFPRKEKNTLVSIWRYK